MYNERSKAEAKEVSAKMVSTLLEITGITGNCRRKAMSKDLCFTKRLQSLRSSRREVIPSIFSAWIVIFFICCNSINRCVSPSPS